jgi:hypothetical protein
LRHLFQAASQKFSDREGVVRVILFELAETKLRVVLHLLVVSVAPFEGPEYQVDIMIPSPPVTGSQTDELIIGDEIEKVFSILVLFEDFRVLVAEV